MSLFFDISLKRVVAIGAAAAAVIGFIIYQDHDRRMTAIYNKTILQHKRRQQKGVAQWKLKAVQQESTTELVEQIFRTKYNLTILERDRFLETGVLRYEDLRRTFLQEVQLGEERYASGDVESALTHFALAVAMCDIQEQVLKIFRQTLPPDHYKLLVKIVPIGVKRCVNLLRPLVHGQQSSRYIRSYNDD